jgi:hypothetical protein
MTDTRATTGSLVILGASERAARLADDLPCPVVHVAKPGGDVSALVRGDASYYSVDYAGPGFDDFAEAVLRPLKPRAVVSLTETGVLPAARANETLGLPGTPGRPGTGSPGRARRVILVGGSVIGRPLAPPGFPSHYRNRVTVRIPNQTRTWFKGPWHLG